MSGFGVSVCLTVGWGFWAIHAGVPSVWVPPAMIGLLAEMLYIDDRIDKPHG